MDVLERPSCQTCSRLCSFGFQSPLCWHLWQAAGGSALGCAGSAGWILAVPVPLGAGYSWQLVLTHRQPVSGGEQMLQSQMEHGQLPVLGTAGHGAGAALQIPGASPACSSLTLSLSG